MISAIFEPREYDISNLRAVRRIKMYSSSGRKRVPHRVTYITRYREIDGYLINLNQGICLIIIFLKKVISFCYSLFPRCLFWLGQEGDNRRSDLRDIHGLEYDLSGPGQRCHKEPFAAEYN